MTTKIKSFFKKTVDRIKSKPPAPPPVDESISSPRGRGSAFGYVDIALSPGDQKKANSIVGDIESGQNAEDHDLKERDPTVVTWQQRMIALANSIAGQSGHVRNTQESHEHHEHACMDNAYLHA
jgi:hypothetical protein